MTSAHPRKLIEVALPLPEINDASSYDKMPGIGPHPKDIHHWWARRTIHILELAALSAHAGRALPAKYR
jgi:hypothetical protein